MKLIRLESTDSTNTRAFHYLNQFDSVVVIAGAQSEGRGRGEHRWESPPGNIYLSVGKTLDTHCLRGLSVRVAIHLASGLAPLLKGEKLRVKWPNDLYLNDKKVAGILTESKITSEKARVVAGIGLNIAIAPLESSTSLSELATINHEEVEQTLVEAILAAFSDRDFASLGKRLRELSWFGAGDHIRFLENGSPVTALFEGYDQNLAMIVRMNNENRTITVSEVSRLR
ncbi:MAG: biotin--[acetyl-CoA-carboxylase] ligase [Acidobacteria bacterium CG_4_9_14_3_um_filter_49_7]|nr:MAG: biotin--[acetyl-CoA-carboxylase] ligase [Acidobacteria bacterium CG_4_9_14_3_um_filter_49_7]